MEVSLLSMQEEIKCRKEINNIGDDFILIEDFSDLPMLMYPFKIDMFILLICTQGVGSGSIDMYPYSLKAPSVLIIRPNQILNYEYLSSDFAGYCMMLSNRVSLEFVQNINNGLPIISAIRENPFAQLKNDDLVVVRKFFVMLKRLLAMTENPYRLEMVKHQLLVYFYLVRPYFQIFTEPSKLMKNGDLIEKFTQLIRENHHQQREIAFYADKLNFTPKYLSQLIRSGTGKSASDWIEDFVMLEAKALLKSTNMTIQQISDELNFPSQSSFGKYFKRCEGISPSEYKNKG